MLDKASELVKHELKDSLLNKNNKFRAQCLLEAQINMDRATEAILNSKAGSEQ